MRAHAKALVQRAFRNARFGNVCSCNGVCAASAPAMGAPAASAPAMAAALICLDVQDYNWISKYFKGKSASRRKKRACCDAGQLDWRAVATCASVRGPRWRGVGTQGGGGAMATRAAMAAKRAVMRQRTAAGPRGRNASAGAQFPERHGACGGHVEGIDAVVHGDAHGVVAACDGGGGQAVAFGAQHERQPFLGGKPRVVKGMASSASASAAVLKPSSCRRGMPLSAHDAACGWVGRGCAVRPSDCRRAACGWVGRACAASTSPMRVQGTWKTVPMDTRTARRYSGS